MVPLEAVRLARGCDAEAVLKSVGDATHPKWLRWVFNLAAQPDSRRDLRFWIEELREDGQRGSVDKWTNPKTVIAKILGSRRGFPRGEIERQWTFSSNTIARLVRAGELAEAGRELTRESLAAFLERRLQ